jgi:LacI family transcriptional regulator
MKKLLALDAIPDGVFCFNDGIAAGAMEAILEAGLRIPQDVAVIGAGNVRYSNLLRVPLSTIDQDSSRIGASAAELLLEEMLSSTPMRPRTVMMPLQLVERESTRRA